jgi:xanthine dehydrogenase YagT iron-sulfur-binding subunit
VVFVRCEAGYTPAVQEATGATAPAEAAEVTVTLTVDGSTRTATVDTRTSLLDALRERLGVTAPKKGCDHGQCGACTVLLDGRRTLSCLALAVAQQGRVVVTASGLDDSGDPHPMQEAFVEHDALQCGYCTPGQICSAVGVLEEAAAGHPSLVTDPDATAGDAVPLSDEEIRERMSGNLCRCGAYVGIVAAIRDVAAQRSQVPAT